MWPWRGPEQLSWPQWWLQETWEKLGFVFGLEGTFKSRWFQHSAMGSDTFPFGKV